MVETQFAWFYDILLIAVLIAYIVIGCKRGLLKSVVLIAGYVVAIICAFFVAKEYSPKLYDQFLSSKADAYVSENIDNFETEKELRLIIDQNNLGIYISDADIKKIVTDSDNISDGLIDYLNAHGVAVNEDLKAQIKEQLSSDGILNSLKGRINDTVYNILDEYNKKTDNSIENLLKKLVGDDKDSVASEISDKVVKPLIIKVIEIVLFVLVFIVIIIVVRLVAGLFKAVNRVPLAGGINIFLGGVLGFVQGLVVVYIATLVIRFSIAVTQNDLMFFNEATIQETKIFKYLYEFKLFK